MSSNYYIKLNLNGDDWSGEVKALKYIYIYIHLSHKSFCKEILYITNGHLLFNNWMLVSRMMPMYQTFDLSSFTISFLNYVTWWWTTNLTFSFYFN